MNNLKRVKSILVLVILFFVFVVSCGSSKSTLVEKIDADQDGIWDYEDKFPGDTDNDGVINEEDEDDDNDGVLDSKDAFPLDPKEWLDTDSDGFGDNADDDDDGDGILDINDVFPKNKDEWSDADSNGIGDNADPDDDGDGFTDEDDLFPKDATKAGDHDGDGVDSLVDLDDDNDGYLDVVELDEGSDSLSASSKPQDSDNDGLTDKQENQFGSNPSLKDTDGDGLDDKVEFYLKTDPNSSDTDDDGIGDFAEVGDDLNNLPDFDKDGIVDARDYYSSFEFRTLENDPQESHDRFGLSVDENGTIYISNYIDDMIETYSSEGVQVDLFAGDGFLSPTDVSVFNVDSLFLADTYNDSIVELDSADQILQIFEHQPDGTPGGFISPKGVDVDSSGNIYVADTWFNRIQKYNVVTSEWDALGENGIEDGQFTDPQDIAISDDGIVAVADTGNFRVQLFDENLNFISVIDNASLGLIPFDFRPRSVDFDSEGNLYIVDDASVRIVVVDNEGQFLRSFGLEGSDNGEFIFPTGIHIDENDKIYVTDRFRVQVF